MSNPACDNGGGPVPTREWTRDSLNCSVVANNSLEDLNMRRKAEILKYDSGMNKLTKKQQWAKAARGEWLGKKGYASQVIGGIVNPNTSNLERSGNFLLCPFDAQRQQASYPASSSGVPGNSTLNYNPLIPLYNYRVQRVYKAGGNKWPFSNG